MSRTSYLRQPLAALLLAAVLAASVVMAAVVLASPAQAAEPIIVNYGPDEVGNDGRCTLREAIISANTNAASGTLDGECTAGSATGEDTVNFSLGSSARIAVVTEASPYEGLGPLPPITDPAGLAIDGGSADITVMGERVLVVFDDVVAGAQLTLKNLTVSHLPTADVDGGGRGIVNHGTLEVINSTISNSFVNGTGGAISNSGGTVEVINATISNNLSGSGSGIANFNGGTLKVINATISNNSAGRGGGIDNSDGGMLQVINSTLSGNSATAGTLGGGGGIYNDACMAGPCVAATVINSTLSGNSADNLGLGDGGGISNHGLLLLVGSTLSGNSAGRGGGIYTPGTVLVANTIVANNDANNFPQNCLTTSPGPIVDRGYNLSSDNSCFFSPENNSLPDTDPLLDPDGLQENGGPAKTIALQKGSPAIDAIPDANGSEPGCGGDGVATDQRGVARPQDGDDDGTVSCDIGAFELEPPTQGALSINDTSVSEGNSSTTNATFTVSLSKASLQPVTVNYATAEGTATAGTDYQSSTGTLAFAPSQTTKTVSVTVNGDTQYEPDDTFFVDLSSPTNATISDPQGKGTITNDDPPPDTTAPEVTETYPGTINGILANKTDNVTAKFDEAVQGVSPTTFKLEQVTTNRRGVEVVLPVTAKVTTIENDTKAVLDPTKALQNGGTYRATLTDGVTDTATPPNKLATYSWKFKVATR